MVLVLSRSCAVEWIASLAASNDDAVAKSSSLGELLPLRESWLMRWARDDRFAISIDEDGLELWDAALSCCLGDAG